MPFDLGFLLPATNALFLSDPVHSFGAAAVAFFLVIGVMLLFDIDLDTKVVAGIVLLLIGLAILFFLLLWQDIGGILVGVVAALVSKEIIERGGWL